MNQASARRGCATFLLVLAVLACGSMQAANAQAAPSPSQTQAAEDRGSEASTILRVRSRLVVLDVAVRDAHNQPVRGLPREAFHVSEDRALQQIRSFDAHTSSDTLKAGPPPPALPPGAFTNYTPVPQDGNLAVLLIDALNTPASAQTYLRDQLVRYVQRAPRGRSTAIFGLNSQLTLLQEFTQDPDALRFALQRRAGRNGSILLDDPNGTRNDSVRASEAFADLGPGTDDAVASLQQFESDTSALQSGLRAQYTLDALTTLGEYLAAFPGRKNLIWFSGAFPVNLLPDPAVTNGFRGMQLNAEQLARTSRLLTEARVAVFPVDARGLQTSPVFDAANSGRRYATTPAKAGQDIQDFNATTAAEQTAMRQIAADTGGRAFINTNALADAVAEAAREGEDFYTLTYRPTNKAEDGALRHIHVDLTRQYAAPGMTLSYRMGYLATTPQTPASLSATMAGKSAAPQVATTADRMALGFGAPPMQGILFQARIEPAQPSQAGKSDWYTVHFGALTNGLTFTPSANRRVAHIGFQVLIYSAQGELEDRTGKQLSLNLSAAEYATVQEAGIGLSCDIHAKPGSFLRLIVEDVPSHRLGTVQVPLARVTGASQ